MDTFRLDIDAPVQSIGRGYITLDFPFGKFEVWAGRYADKPHGFAGIKVASEINKECAVALDIPDFSVPVYPAEVERALVATIALGAAGSPVYVGCMGGQGRTGLFLALLRKVSERSCRGVWQWLTEKPDDPVAWVRENYLVHACETREQAEYVHQFNTYRVERIVKRM